MKFQNVDLEKSTLVHGLPGCGKTWFLLQLLDELTAQGQEVYFCDTKEIESFCETDEKRRERYLNKAESAELIHRLFDEIDARYERLDRGEEVAPVYVLIDELFEFLEDALVKNHLMSLFFYVTFVLPNGKSVWWCLFLTASIFQKHSTGRPAIFNNH